MGWFVNSPLGTPNERRCLSASAKLFSIVSADTKTAGELFIVDNSDAAWKGLPQTQT
jgi:hypothetical protein